MNKYQKQAQLIKRMDVNTLRWNENMNYLVKCKEAEEPMVFEELNAINEEKNLILQEAEGAENG